MRKIILLLLLFFRTVLPAQVPERPSPSHLYNNLSKELPDFLNTQEAQQLEEKLETFSNETSNQICVVVVDDFNGMTADEFATELINQWGIGKKDKNNGLVVLIKPNSDSRGKRELFIGVGYGLEGAIPDLATKRVREEEMNPYLKQKEYFTALDKGTDKLMALAKGEVNVKDYSRQNNGPDFLKNHQLLFIIIIVIIF
ncbi:MAG: TPM domain-containing protein, partial [Bacteroidia bacterium]